MKINEILINVRFSEIDSMMLAHNSVYYIWFEEGRFDFSFRVLNFTHKTLNQEILLPVIKSECKYLSPIRLGDTLLLQTLMNVGQSAKITFYYNLFDKDRTICHAIGKTEHALVTREGKMLLKFPQDVKEIFENAYENNKVFFADEEFVKAFETRLG